MDNIAIIITKLNGGGAERCASNLSVELSKKYNVYFIVFDGSNITYPYAGTLINLDIVDSHNTFNRIINVIKRVHAIKKIKRDNHIKCSVSLLDGPNIVNVLSKGKEKVIISVRNRLSGENVGRLRRKLIQLCSKYSDITVALSKMVKKDLVDEFGIEGEKIVTIYNHCDSTLLHSLVEQESKPEFINDDMFYITTIGRLNYQKGQWHLIRAFKEVLNAVPNACLVIVGEGELEDRLKQLVIDLNISEHVVFTGYIKNPHKILEYSEMFVFPSLFEGLGNVLLEALAFHKAIISTDCNAGPREILAPDTDLNIVTIKRSKEKYGILVPVMGKEHFNAYEPLDNKELELSKAIIELHNDESLRKSYERAAEKRIKDFDKKNIMLMWERCIDDV